jgi:hypothetical protein
MHNEISKAAGEIWYPLNDKGAILDGKVAIVTGASRVRRTT